MNGIQNLFLKFANQLNELIGIESAYPQPGFVDEFLGLKRVPVLLIFRFITVLSITARFLIYPHRQNEQLLIISSLVFAFVLLGFAAYITYHSLHKYWVLLLTIADISLISLLYWLTGKPQSDLFLFYSLPLLTITQYFGSPGIVWVFGIATNIGLLTVILTIDPENLDLIQLLDLIIPRSFMYVAIISFMSWRQLVWQKILVRRDVELQALLDFRREIASVFDADRILEHTVKKAVEIMKAVGGYAFLVEYDTEKPRLSFSTPSFLNDTAVDLYETVLKTLQAEKMPSTVSIYSSSDLGKYIDIPFSSLINTPIVSHERFLGIVGIGLPKLGQHDQDSQRFLETLADQASSAIERSRLLTALRTVGSTTASAIELSHEIEALLQELTKKLEFDFATISLVDIYQQTIETVQGINVPTGWMRRSKYSLESEDIQADIVRTGKTEIIAGWDVRFNREIYERFGHDRLARVFTPLAVDGKVIAVLEAGCSSERQAELLSTERVQSVKNLGQARASRISRARPYVLLELIANHAIKIVGADSASIHVYQYSEVFLQAGAGKATVEFIRQFPPRSDGIGRQSIRLQKPIIDDSHNFAINHPSLFAEGVRAIAAFPLLIGEGIDGVLYVHFWREHQFSPTEVELESIFTRQMEVVIQHHLFLKDLAAAGEKAQALPRLQNVVQALASSLDLSQVLEDVAQNALYALDADNVTLYQYYQEEQRVGTPPVMRGDFKHKMSMRESMPLDSIVWQIIHDGRSQIPLVTNDSLQIVSNTYNEHRSHFVEREEIKSSACMVLKDEDANEIVGLLFVNYRSKHTFGIEEENMMNALASSAAIAIRTARLYERVDKTWKDFAAKTAHIIGTRVTVINGFIELILSSLQKDDALSSKTRGLLENLSQGIVKTKEILADFRRFAAPLELRIQKINLISLLQATISEVRHTILCPIETNFDNNPIWIQGDMQKLSDAFMELIWNSNQAMQKSNSTQSPKITISTSLTLGSKVHLEFADVGPGIPVSDKPHIFKPFFSRKDRSSGLGLTIIKDIIEAHNGHIEETGVEGEGAVFVISLPIVE